MGRRKIEIVMVKDPNTRQVTFSKRRTGLFKKANELSILCGAEVAIVVFSPGNKPYSFGHPSVDVVASKFLQQDPNSNDVQENNNDDTSNEVCDLNRLNQQLSHIQAQIRDEEKKGAMFDDKLKQQQHQVTHLSQYETLLCSYSTLQRKVKDYLDAIEVSESLMLLSQDPIVGTTKEDSTKKRRKN